MPGSRPFKQKIASATERVEDDTVPLVFIPTKSVKRTAQRRLSKLKTELKIAPLTVMLTGYSEDNLLNLLEKTQNDGKASEAGRL